MKARPGTLEMPWRRYGEPFAANAGAWIQPRQPAEPSDGEPEITAVEGELVRDLAT